MPTSFARKILNIDNGIGNDRPIQWSVLDHETKTSNKFNTKLDALLYKNTLSHATLFFHWYENQFIGKIAEPADTFEELKRQRAQEIRDQYSYVRLWYSGGSDSQTALNAFVKNNIHIDEIVIHILPDHATNDPMQSGSREALISALPYIEKIKNLIPNTKITKIMPDKSDYSRYLSGPDALGELPFLHTMDRGAFLFHMSSPQCVWEKILNTTEVENYCDVYGGTKPMVCIKNGKYYFYMIDSGLTDYFLSTRAEDFFISKTNPKLFLKTVYMLANFLKRLGKNEKEINRFHTQADNIKLYNKIIGRDSVHDVAIIKTDRGNGYTIDEQGITVQGIKQTLFIQNVISDPWWNNLFKQHIETYHFLKNNYDFVWQKDSTGTADPNLGYAGHVSLLHSLDDGLSYDNAQIFKNGFLI